MPTVFHEGRNRAFAELDAPINGSANTVVLKAGHGNRMSDVTTASGRKVRANLYHRDPDTGEITKIEEVRITNNVSDVLTIARAVSATRNDTDNTYTATAQSFEAGDFIEEVISSDVMDEIRDAINALETDIPNIYATKAQVQAGSLVYGSTSTGNDSYAITPSPAIGAYASGQTFKFIADVANTGTASLNVNGLGAKTIYKQHDQTLVTGDIEVGQLVEVVYNANLGAFEMVSQIATVLDLSGYAARTKQYTISGGVIAGDVVYPSAADTVKKLYPSDTQTLGASLSTSPTSNGSVKLIQISNGVVLQVTGSDGGAAGNVLKAQVRTINSGETDFTFGSEETLFASAVTWFDVCQIDTSTFIAIYNKGASGAIACVAFTISGTTITVGSEQSIETSGTTSWKCSIAKVDTLKCLITYMKSSDSKPYVQVLTVSGTAITTNTPVLLKNTTNGQKTASCQITTNQVLIVYGDTVDTYRAVTVNVSGTTPTINTEITVQNIGTGCKSVEVKRVSDTKAVCVIETGSSNQLGLKVLSLSGTGNNTISAGAITTISSANANNNYRGLQIVGDSYLIFSSYRTTSTDMYVNYYSIGATTTTLISTQTTAEVTSASYPSVAICKVSPWTYLVTGISANSDFLVKLTPVSSCRIGVAEGTIADAATGYIAKRFQNAILSSLTVNSKYYADDNGQITVNSSLTAPEVGYADSTTNLILT